MSQWTPSHPRGEFLYHFYYDGRRRFEFDPAKSVANKAKHGIDFGAAQALWSDPNLLESPVLFTAEPRYLVIGLIGAKHWSAVVTYRGEYIPLISVRRARKEEMEHYESD